MEIKDDEESDAYHKSSFMNKWLTKFWFLCVVTHLIFNYQIKAIIRKTNQPENKSLCIVLISFLFNNYIIVGQGLNSVVQINSP